MSTSHLPDFNRPNYLARIYFWSVFFLGLLAFLFTFFNTPESEFLSKSIWNFIFFVVLNIFAELAITRIPVGGSLTASFSVILTVLLVQGPIYAIISAIIGATISTIFIQKRSWDITLFNSGLFSIIFVSAGFSVEYLKNIFAFKNDQQVFPILILAFTVMIIYMILSSVVVNTYIHLTTGAKFSILLWEDRWEMAQLIVLTPISVLGVYFYYSIGIFATLAAFIPAIFSVYLIKSYINTNESNTNLRSLNENLEQLYDVTKKINSQTKMKELWLTTISETSSLIPYERCLIYLINEDSTYLILEQGDLLYAPVEIHDLLEDGPLQNCVARRITITNNDFTPPETYGSLWKAFKSILAEPIIVDGEVKGAICFLSEERDSFQFEHNKFARLLLSSVENTIKSINLYEQTQKQALNDGLTSLYHQKYFKNQVKSELLRANHYNYSTSIIMLDVDYFKKFNDTHGHLLGDFVLVDIAKILKSFCKNTYVASRYGGEEFAILLPETKIDEACELAENIRLKVSQHKFIGREQREVRLSVSIGVNVHFSQENGEVLPDEFIDRADTALYRAKNEGRNQVYKAEYSPAKDQLIVKNYSKNDKVFDKKSQFVFTLGKESCEFWKLSFDKFNNWLASDENVSSKNINIDYQEFFINVIMDRLEAPDKKSALTNFEEEAERKIISKLHFPTDFYKFEIELEEIEKVLFDYIATLKVSEIEKDHIRKIIIGIFNKIYAMAIKYTSNHYQKIVDYHTNIAHINSEIGTISTKQTFYSNIAKLTSEILDAKFSFIAELDPSKRFFEMKSFYGCNDFKLIEKLDNLEFNVDKITNKIINYGEIIQLTTDEVKEISIYPVIGKLNIQSGIIVPLILKNKQVTGILACFDDSSRSFSPEETKICDEIAQRVIKAIGRIEKNISERDSYLEVIKAMIDIFEARNNFSKDHSKNTSRIAGRIAKALDIPNQEQNDIRTAAYLHDIGKLGLTSDKINDESFVKPHPLIGARLISSVDELKKLASAIRHHHENWDGSGYPDGLEGSRIPLYSRIIAIANNYEEYIRNFSNHHDAMDKMKESNLFDPEICEIVKTKLFSDNLVK